MQTFETLIYEANMKSAYLLIYSYSPFNTFFCTQEAMQLFSNYYVDHAYFLHTILFILFGMGFI